MLCFNIDDQGEDKQKDVYHPWRSRSKDHSYIEEQVFVSPRLCTWRFITPNDAVYLKERQRDKRAILSFFEKAFPTDIAPLESDDCFFTKLAWKMFKSLRDESFTEKAISSALGLMYITHIFLLSSSKHTPEDVYKFFYDGIFMHTVLDPPECDEVFTVKECELLFQLFNNLYLQNVRLLHLKNFPDYYRPREVSVAPSTQEEEKSVEMPAKKLHKKKKKKKLHL